ncbi:hypothetical protein J1C56_01515 [Aminobacter anthyllidis]|uniref:Uncharacterized protein n=1 Tax=Aminobacter anthyllidis TaxID=1035067 RepID=A0A9X1D449_9HYPH|nr:hypothetical protein [Aminobacter anthyllidis]MBT1154263.1 hypothetical protein [Aminobacter anthyllidis]
MQGSFLKIVVVVLLLLVGTPIIGSLIFNVAAAAYIMQMMGMVNDSQQEAAERRASDFQGIKVVPENAPRLVALRNFDDFEQTRTVSLNMHLRLPDIRRGDQTSFDANDVEGYLASRLPVLARAECDMIVKAFASKCAVNKVSARPSDDVYQVNMRLTFVQREPFGEVAKAQELNYVEIPLNLNDGDDKSIMIDSWVSQRTEYYDAVAKGCAKIRAQNKNCAVMTVTIASTPQRGSSAIEVNAGARYAILQ